MAAGYLSESRPPRWPTGNAHVPQTHRTASIERRNSGASAPRHLKEKGDLWVRGRLFHMPDPFGVDRTSKVYPSTNARSKGPQTVAAEGSNRTAKKPLVARTHHSRRRARYFVNRHQDGCGEPGCLGRNKESVQADEVSWG